MGAGKDPFDVPKKEWGKKSCIAEFLSEIRRIVITCNITDSQYCKIMFGLLFL